MKFLNLQPDIFGIDINDLSLRIIKLRKKRHGFALLSYGSAHMKQGVVKEGVIQDSDALAMAIKSACQGISGKKLATTYVALSLPEEKSFSQVIQMPQMTHEELVGAVPLEAENYIPLTIDKVYMDFEQIISEKGGSRHVDVLINVIPRAIVDSYVVCIKKAGLVPCVMEIESQSIVRALLKNGQSQESVIFIDIGETRTSFIIFAGNAIRFTSSIPISSQQLTLAIANTLKITPAKAEDMKIKYGLSDLKGDKGRDLAKIMEPILSDLVVQIKKYMSFYYSHAGHDASSEKGTIAKVILCGGGANLKGLGDFLAKELKIAVDIGNPFANITPRKQGNKYDISYQEALSFTSAIGLAIRGASENI